MTESASSKVDKFIQDIQYQSPEKHEILVALREMISKTNPKLEQGIKYGGLVFTLSNVLLGGVFVYKNHLSLEMGKGPDLPDPDKILEGKGKTRRHIKMSTIEDIRAKKVESFVKKAFV